ncbi:MAG: ABC transporter ATP-binding protein, partial [Spirochaetaceae bacterium]|nr:ABC transporter ATP-binding protein [Spirochaetaceae bacterium]
ALLDGLRLRAGGRYSIMEEIDGRQKLKLPLWRSLLRFAAPMKRRFVLLGAMMVSVAAIDAAQPFLTGWAIDNIALSGALGRLPAFMVLFGALMALQAVLVRVFIGVGGRIEMGMNYSIRSAAFARLQELSFSYFDKTSAGWITSRLTSDVGRLADIITWGIIDMVWGLSMMAVSAAIMLATNWRLGLLSLSALPLLVLASVAFERGLLERSRLVRKTNSRLTAAFSENIRGVRAVKTLVAEERQGRAFRSLSETMRKASTRQAMLSALYLPLVVFLGYIGTSLALWRGGLSVMGGSVSLGLLSAFIFSALRFFDPATDLARVIADLQYAQASAERVIGLIETEPEIVDGPEAKAMAAALAAAGAAPGVGAGVGAGVGERRRLRGRVTFESVTHSYDGAREALRGFSLDVPAGSTIALVGETGSGKSTVVNLACRFYEPTQGRILIDGTDYRELPLAYLHGNLGYVLQQPYLFFGTVRDNIRYGRLDASDAEVEAAARVARAHDFIAGTEGARGLEGGYGAQVGEGGLLLSTGQKQLISLARAVLADPAILVLDEATSSVDTETEKLVQEAIAAVLKGRTSFVIAHRLSTIVGADLILVMKDGSVVEKGAHSELMLAGGYYRRLYIAQFAQEEERELFGPGQEDEEAESA